MSHLAEVPVLSHHTTSPTRSHGLTDYMIECLSIRDSISHTAPHQFPLDHLYHRVPSPKRSNASLPSLLSFQKHNRPKPSSSYHLILCNIIAHPQHEFSSSNIISNRSSLPASFYEYPVHNLKISEKVIRNAVAAGAKACFLPEASDFINPSKTESRKFSHPLPKHEYTIGLQRLAKELGIVISVGVHEGPEDESEERVYNTHVLIGKDGGILASYRKV